MSALVPEVGDRYERDGYRVQVVAIERCSNRDAFARLRRCPLPHGGAEKPVTLEKLAFDGRFRYLGNFLPPEGFKVIQVGAHWYYKTPAGNVHGALAGLRWTEVDVLREARSAALAGAMARSPA